MMDVEKKFRIPLGQKQFKLVCPVISSEKDMLMIQWMKNGEQVEWDSRYKLAKDDRELRMKNVRLEDSGRFQCQATNGFGHKIVDFTLHVFDPEESAISVKDAIVLSNTSSPPVWLIDMNMEWSSPIQINRGGRLELKCPVKGNPLPDIRWYKNNMMLSNDAPPHIASLVIDPVTVNDSGDYRCVVENRLGSLDSIFKVIVGDFFDDRKRLENEDNSSEQSLEPIIDQPYNTTVDVGRTAQFQCKANALQSPLIKWLKEITDPIAVKRKDPNATIVNANGMHLLVIEHTQVESVSKGINGNLYSNRLIIPLVTKEHAGRYICVVTSSQGQIVYKAAQLTVLPAYEFGPTSLSDTFWYFVIPIAIVFVILVICAIIWLRSNQEPSTSKCLTGKPPPPPRIPPPVTPAEYQQSHSHLNNQEYCLEKTRTPVILNNSMFQQKFPMGIATLDRKNIQRAQRGYDEMPNLYDSGSPQPYWHHVKGNSQSIYTPTSGNYRTLEVGYPQGKHFPSFCSDDYSEQERPFITYRR